LSGRAERKLKRLVSPFSKEIKRPISPEGWQFQVLSAFFLKTKAEKRSR
jgi:hypothetical protein